MILFFIKSLALQLRKAQFVVPVVGQFVKQIFNCKIGCEHTHADGSAPVRRAANFINSGKGAEQFNLLRVHLVESLHWKLSRVLEAKEAERS